MAKKRIRSSQGNPKTSITIIMLGEGAAKKEWLFFDYLTTIQIKFIFIYLFVYKGLIGLMTYTFDIYHVLKP